MSIKLEKYIVLFVTLLLSAGIIAWTFFLHFGKIQITSNQPFTIQGLGKTDLNCPKTSCLHKVPIGNFNVTFHAENFRNLRTKIEIKRFQTSELDLIFEYQPILNTLQNTIAKEELPIPTELKKDISPTWNKQNNKIVYLQNNENLLELLIWDKQTKESNKITNFYSLKKPQFYWDNLNKNILLQDQNDFYLIDLTQNIKHKLNNFQTEIQPLFSPNSENLLFSNNETIFLQNLKTNEISIINLSIDPNNLLWKTENSLIYFTINQNSSTFYDYNLKNQTTSLILEIPFIEMQNIHISSDLKHLYFKVENQSYEIILSQ